jgi:N utilization substance protein A
MRGTRVQAIIRELRGEKIDIVEFSEDPVTFVTKALSPARVQRVSIVDDEQRVMEVVVEDRQLSLAIGKKGQNVRLAAKLTGWKIDIKSEEDKRKEVELQLAGIEFGDANVETLVLTLPDIHDEVVAVLRAAGYDSVEKLIEADPEQLAQLPGFDAETVEAVLSAARQQQVVNAEAAAAQAEAAAEAEAAAQAAAAEAGEAGEAEAGSDAEAGEAEARSDVEAGEASADRAAGDDTVQETLEGSESSAAGDERGPNADRSASEEDVS